MKSKRLSIILLLAGVILLLPLIAMQFTSEEVWTGFDFVLAGILLFGTGLIIELVLRKTASLKKRIIFFGIILVVFFLVWAELAVGIFGTPFAGD